MNNKEIEIASAIFSALASFSNPNGQDLHRIKRHVSKETKTQLIDNTRLLGYYNALVGDGRLQRNKEIENLLLIKRIRSQSGVAIVTLLTMPFPCPGKCIYCPDEERMPKSYIANEPAAQRALRLKFDPYLQTIRRIEMLEKNGHAVDKIELIVKGGTWSSYPIDYQQWFIRECYRAMNDAGHVRRSITNVGDNLYNRFDDKEKSVWSVRKLLKEEEKNETAAHRCIGMTIETRPDCISMQELKRLRILGCTRVELGVQTIEPAVLDLIQRGHTIEKVIHATQLLKDAGFKVDYHLMPGLPGATPQSDFESAQTIFSDASYQPDTIKLYPCVVTPNTELEQWWKDGRYTPYCADTLIPLLSQIKSIVPPYVRIARVIRDIPGEDISAGNTITNLREMLVDHMKKNGMTCRCLRCREVGHQDSEIWNKEHATPTIMQRTYNSSGGQEHFLSFESEDEKILYAFLRLRFPSPDAPRIWKHIPELEGAAIVRELHTYGTLVPINTLQKDASQHKGYGKRLLERAESLAKDAGYAKLIVIAGIGVREYYAKNGYKKEGTYMIKIL